MAAVARGLRAGLIEDRTLRVGGEHREHGDRAAEIGLREPRGRQLAHLEPEIDQVVVGELEDRPVVVRVDDGRSRQDVFGERVPVADRRAVEEVDERGLLAALLQLEDDRGLTGGVREAVQVERGVVVHEEQPARDLHLGNEVDGADLGKPRGFALGGQVGRLGVVLLRRADDVVVVARLVVDADVQETLAGALLDVPGNAREGGAGESGDRGGGERDPEGVHLGLLQRVGGGEPSPGAAPHL